MSDVYFTTMRMSSEIWRRINREREPRENFNDVLKRIMDERDRLKTYAKGIIPDLA